MAKTKSNRGSFRKRLDSTLKTINTPTFRRGFSDINLWVSSSNFAMNRRWSGQFDKAYLFGRNYVFYGESGSGKSLMCAIAAGNAQREHGAFIFWIDVEHATDDDAGKEWLRRAGVNIDDPELFEYASAATLEEIKTCIMQAAKSMQDMINDGEEPQPMMIVVDSWAAALTSSQMERVDGKKMGELVGDMGQKAKQTGDVILATTHACAGKPLMVIGVQHIMDNQDGYGRKHKTTGGNKMIYYASGCMLLTKKELKDDDDQLNDEVKRSIAKREETMTVETRKKMSNFVGITAVMEILKTRVSKPFERVDIQIPWETGLDPYSGLFDLFQQEGVVKKGKQGWYFYLDETGTPVNFQKGSFRDHADRIMVLADSNIGDGATNEVVPDEIEEEEELNDE